MLEAMSQMMGSSPVVAGCVMLIMNLGGKYVALDMPKGMDAFFSHPWVRKLTVFAIAFMATRNLKVSLLLLLLFILFAKYLFNENSRSCIPAVRTRVHEAMAAHEEKLSRARKEKKEKTEQQE
jgi:hypothetical protein